MLPVDTEIDRKMGKYSHNSQNALKTAENGQNEGYRISPLSDLYSLSLKSLRWDTTLFLSDLKLQRAGTLRNVAMVRYLLLSLYPESRTLFPFLGFVYHTPPEVYPPGESFIVPLRTRAYNANRMNFWGSNPIFPCRYARI